MILKAIGFKYLKSTVERKQFIKETFHNLYDIAEYIFPYIKEYIEEDMYSYNWMMSIFDDMNSIDKESDSFRYPFGIIKKTTSSFGTYKPKFEVKIFFDKETHIDLISFANKMEIIFYILKGYYLEKKQKVKETREYSTIFLEEGGEYYAKSVIGYNYSIGKFYCNVTAYRNCADILYDIISKNNDKKNLFMPMCYLYRNSVELAMKEILFEESSFGFQESLKKLNDNKHRVHSLWKEIKDDIRKHAQVNEDDIILKNIEMYIKHLNEIDGSADIFRYPIGKSLNVYFAGGRSFDLNNVRDFFEHILCFFKNICYMMSEQNEILREIQAEAMSYY